MRGSDFRCGHGCLRQEFSGAAPSNKPLRYVGTRPNSTRGFLCTLLCLFLWSAKTPFDRGIHPFKNVTDPRRILLILKSDRVFRRVGNCLRKRKSYSVCRSSNVTWCLEAPLAAGDQVRLRRCATCAPVTRVTPRCDALPCVTRRNHPISMLAPPPGTNLDRNLDGA